MSSIHEKLSKHHQEWKSRRKPGRKLGCKNKPKKQIGPELPFMYEGIAPITTPVIKTSSIKTTIAYLENQCEFLSKLEHKYMEESGQFSDKKDSLMICVRAFLSQREAFEDVIRLLKSK